MWPNQAMGGCKSYGKPPENLSFFKVVATFLAPF
jgi:hypothetical protein